MRQADMRLRQRFEHLDRTRIYEKDTDKVFIEGIDRAPAIIETILLSFGQKASRAKFISPQSQHVGSSGTIDIDVTLEDGSRVLIENKIDAGYSTTRLGVGQVDRYRKTVEALRAAGTFAFSVLLAPQSYLNSSRSTKDFDCAVSYETLIPFLEAEAQTLIRDAVVQARTPYEPDPDLATGEFFSDYRQFTADRFPALVLKQNPNANDVRPTGSHTLYFDVAQTLFRHRDLPKPRMSLQCRDSNAPSASAKIMVGGWGHHAAMLEPCPSLINAGAYLRSAGKSLGIVINTPQLDTQRPFADQTGEVVEGLEAALRLQGWWDASGATLNAWRTTIDRRLA